MIVGRRDVGATQYPMPADTKRVARFTLPVAANVANGALYLDGRGGGNSPQVCCQVIYDVNNNLVAQSDEVAVLPGQAPGWVNFAYTAYKGGPQLKAGDFFVGLIAGTYANTIRVYGSDPHGAGGKTNTDPYVGGASNPFGTATGLTADLSCYVAAFAPYATVLPLATDIDYARLPFEDGQAALGANGPDASVGQRLVEVGWHGTFLDPEIGSNALVRDTSPLADLLGERIQVTVPLVLPRTVVAYVHGLADADVIDWDLSLTRHLFGQLGMLADDTITCVVEVMN